MLLVAYCFLFVVRCLLSVVGCCPLSVVGCWLYVVCSLVFIGCGFRVCWSSLIMCGGLCLAVCRLLFNTVFVVDVVRRCLLFDICVCCLLLLFVV